MSRAGRVSRRLWRFISDILDDFAEKRPGEPARLSGEANTSALGRLEDEILAGIRESKLSEETQAFLTNFDKLDEFNITIHGIINGLSPEQMRNITVEQRKLMEDVTRRLISPEGFVDELATPVRQVIYTQITGGARLSEAKRAVKMFVAGDPQTRGYIERWTSQIATDALNQYDGQVQKRISEQYQMDAYRYIGSLIKTSRPQCIRWITKFDGVLRKGKELRDEIAWARSNGSGYSIYTPITEDTFAVYRGGHNCRHRAIPFNIEDDDAVEVLDSSIPEEVDE